MKPTLFWKILTAFWLAVALATASVVLIFAASTHFGRDVRDAYVAQRGERLQSARVALRYGGRPALDQVVAAWPKDMQSRLRMTVGADGKTQLALAPPPITPSFLPWPLAIQFAASLLLSALLAANLARPVSQLRDGLRKLARGDLGVRLTAAMGGRRDEIADLAQDFDAMAERLQQLIASRDRLLHDVSHELRSPLARMSVAVGLARKSGAVPENALVRIETEAERLNEIVGDLLSLSRAENDAGIEEIYFDLGALLQVVCEDARFEAQPRSVEVRLELSPELADPEHAPLLRGAPQLLRRGIENVIRNALRFSPPGDAVVVRARPVDDRFEIEVSDKGPGVPPEMLESMFEPFVKGAAETRGVGLGLSIARRALAAHGGTLQAFNREGGGLSMRIGLPAAG
ncbi:MAG: HAMP domain-containing sensor histidine kinase [Caulobacteraceae bacterium]